MYLIRRKETQRQASWAGPGRRRRRRGSWASPAQPPWCTLCAKAEPCAPPALCRTPSTRQATLKSAFIPPSCRIALGRAIDVAGEIATREKGKRIVHGDRKLKLSSKNMGPDGFRCPQCKALPFARSASDLVRHCYYLAYSILTLRLEGEGSSFRRPSNLRFFHPIFANCSVWWSLNFLKILKKCTDFKTVI